MISNIFRALKQWEKDDKIEKTEYNPITEFERRRVLRSRLDMLLGSAIMSLVFAILFLVLLILGKI